MTKDEAMKRSHKQANNSSIAHRDENENTETNNNQDAKKDGRSKEEIADYLLNKIKKQMWDEGQPNSEQLSKFANNVKSIWDSSSTTTDKTTEIRGFFTLRIKKEELEDTVEKLKNFLQDGMAVFDENERQMVSIAHKVRETNLTHNFDVVELSKRVDHIFETFYDKKNEEGYYAPYLCFVQSSGMGKTKIIYELCKSYKNNSHGNISGRLLLCRSAKGGEKGEKELKLYDKCIAFQDSSYHNSEFRVIVNDVSKKLENELVRDKAEKLVLFFDEAHHLLKDGGYTNGNGDKKSVEAMLFRIVRLWIRKKRQKQRIVAVFTGTTAKLTNFIIKDDLNLELETDTREMSNEGYYELTESNSYKPFYTTTTIGCLRFQNRDSSGQDDYTHAVPYGRPLFASMTSEELEKGGWDIVGRMLRSKINKEWESSQEACLSILGTRVQMGQTSLNLASDLVGRSYANLVSVTQTTNSRKQVESVKICFPPDPVCARFAMCVMNEEWCMNLSDGSILEGKRKIWWVGKMKELYSTNLCLPEKGNFGEVMVALYFLFCADTLRYQLDNDYRTFSVPLDKWIECLINGGSISEKYDNKKKIARKRVSESNCQVYFSAIQVCRNYIRAYDDSWSLLVDEVFLENIYKTGVGFYVFAGCGIIDLVFPLRVAAGKDTYNYIPMFVSVKSHVYFSPSAARGECERMKSKFNETKSSLGALCVLVIFGSSSQSNDKEYTLDSSCFEKLMGGETVAQVLRVPTEDAFGLSEAFLDLTMFQDEKSEVLASNSFLGAHREADNNKDDSNSKVSINDFAEKVLRLRPKEIGTTGGRGKDSILTYTKRLLEELDKIVKKTTSGKNE